MIKIIFSLLFNFPFLVLAQRTDNKLQKQLEAASQNFNGQIGIYVKNLKTGKTVNIASDTIFPSASTVKVPILLGVMQKLSTGELKEEQIFTYKDSLLYAGEDILGSYKNNEKIALKKLIMLMLSTSDNTASLWLQSLAGGGSIINEQLAVLGLLHTRVNSRTEGRKEDREKYGWGQTTPQEMADIFENIYNGQIISSATSEQMMRLLSKNFWDAEGLSQIPPTVAVFSKNGAVDASRNEVMLVNAKRNPYILSIYTKNNKDKSWNTGNEAWTLIREISKMVWERYGN